jgi:CRP-like cAMP-binding protein
MPTRRHFVPLDASEMQFDLAYPARVAHALEFIATQLGEINERLATQEEASVRMKSAEIPTELAAKTEARKARRGNPRG